MIFTGRFYRGGVDENGNEWAEKYHPNLHTSSCGQYWSSEPFTKESEKKLRRMEWKSRIQNLKNRK